METALQQLVATLGDAVRTDPVTCENYRFDWSRDPTAGVPMAVYARSARQKFRQQSDGQPNTGYRSCRAALAVASPAALQRWPEASS
jgi:hypothetical protein